MPTNDKKTRVEDMFMVHCCLKKNVHRFFHSGVLASYIWKERKGKERKGKERNICATGEKDTLRGTRTHTFCCPGRCPNPVRLEETS